MQKSLAQRIARGKHRIANRLDRKKILIHRKTPVFSSDGIHYQLAERTRGMAAGGLGAMQLLVGHVGLAECIDEKVHVLKRHLPYHESDHVLSIAYNILAGGTRLEHIELRRNDEVFLDALGVQSIPDPTTAGDFCRRLGAGNIHQLMEAINAARLRVWQQQPHEFFEEALIDADGTIVETTGECKQGMDISYNGKWGYHPLVISLANTGETLYLLNRSANRPSHEGAAAYFERAAALCRRAGFRKITLRGDTDFTQTKELDRWDAEGIGFVFGADATLNVRLEAELLENKAWERLVRPPKYIVKTQPRRRPDNVKERIVRRRNFKNIRLVSEDVAEFDYSPTACKQTYRMIVVRKNLSVAMGHTVLFPDERYFFYLTNDWDTPAEKLVLSGQRALQPGKRRDRTAQERSARLTRSAGYAPEQLGLHGDGLAGRVVEDLVGLAVAGNRPLARQTPRRKAGGADDGLLDVSCRLPAVALPDCEDGPAADLPLAVVEPVAARVLQADRALARQAVVLSSSSRSRSPDAPVRRGHQPQKAPPR